ncbi:molybdopterin-dependent oxidoreductase [Asticcacaulis solisilvae]|uniref:molybdopterin-dependent oxidoreductase n=1 Tax=Asticcacaulis solisilvae TaxID=1217274 RepID=UPI003FD8CE8B
MTKTVKSVCPYCGVGCGILMDVVNNRVVKVTGDKDHPTNFGRLCTKGNTCGQALAESGRMEKAYIRDRRTGDQLPVAMDEAIRETARRLKGLLDEHGPDAISFYVSGQMSLEAQYLANKLAKGFIRTQHIESNSRLCMASAGSGYKLSLGADGPPGSYQDFDKADLFFVIGANMADCHPILFLRMMDRVKAGARLIVVDPRRSATADKATLFMQIKPGTDLMLLNGLLHILVRDGKVDRGFIATYTQGWDAMPDFLAGYAPDKVAEATGIPEADIERAAAEIGSTRNWMTCWTMGLNQSTHGTWNTNAICNLHLATGAICRPGAGPFSLTGQPNAMGGREMGYMGPGLPGQRTAQNDADRAFIENMWGLDAGTLRKEGGGGTIAMYDDMKAGRIKACWIICTNPVASVANRGRVVEALKAAELVIAQDAFLDTETNIYADILLPGALWAEAEGVMINSERNLTLMQQAVDAPGEATADWRIIARVACEMGYADAFTYGSASDVFEEIKRAWNPKTGYDLRGASHDRLRGTPLQWPCAPGCEHDRNPVRYLNDGVSQTLKIADDGRQPAIVFATESGKGVFLARPHMDPAEMPDPDFPFILNTGRVQHQWHTLTKTGKIPTLNKLNPGPFVEIHPEDAVVMGIADKDNVEIRSRRGRAVLPAVVTDRVRPGNCFAPFHWNDVFGDDLAVNAVTSDAVDPISLQPEFKVSAVALTRIAAPAAPLTPSATPELPSEKALDMQRLDAFADMLGLTHAPAPKLDPVGLAYLQGYLSSLRMDASRAAGGVPTLPPTAPFDAHTRAVLDGMLAGLFSRTWIDEGARPAMGGATVPPQPGTGDGDGSGPGPVTVLWASSTGNAESFAGRCAERLSAAGHKVKVAAMDAVSATELVKLSPVLFLASTFGDGDPPDNGANLWGQIQGEGAAPVDGVRFAVLAFGDSNYDQFCGFGRKLEARMIALGGQALAPRVDCEPDYEAAANGWLNAVCDALVGVEARVLEPAGPMEAAPAAAPVAAPVYSRAAPLKARLKHNRLLSGEGSAKETRQIVFDIAGTGLDYEAGDALGVWPVNCPNLVADILDALRLDGQAPVSVKDHGEIPLADALVRYFEIARITPDFLQFMCGFAGSDHLVALSKPDRKDALRDWMWGRQIIDVLREIPVTTTAAAFVRALKRLQPRLYSIASSPKACPGEVHLTMSTVRYDHGGLPRGGVCSTFLADRAEGVEVPIFVQKSAHFRPPADDSLPMIMVGPGTGVAPFRAFLQERRARGAKGKTWLFFGEQRAACDFYYRDELDALAADGTLSRLDTAFSRDQGAKVYVQDRMIENGAGIWRWLEEGAHFYVCGDASRMARDVDAALRRIAETHGGLSPEGAEAYVRRLASEKRYGKDVY